MLGQAEGKTERGLALVVFASAKAIEVVAGTLLDAVYLLFELAAGLIIDKIASLFDTLGYLLRVLLGEFLCLATQIIKSCHAAPPFVCGNPFSSTTTHHPMSFDHRTEVNWAKFVSCLGFMLAAVRVLPALGPAGLMGANGRGLEVKAKMGTTKK